MNKVAIVVLAGIESGEALGRIVNAMQAAKEFIEAGDDVQVIFDGAGVQWPGVLSKPDHQYHALFQSVEGRVAGVCSYCARAFGVEDSAKACGVSFIGDYEGHPSFRALLMQGAHVLTF